ncbi:MAG TPA: OmpA family protein [Methylophilaceae bacterium]|nr:OmpA family protein [Methylophilaceae bacterium]
MKKNLICLAVAGVFSFGATVASAEDAYQGSWYALPGISIMNPDNEVKADDTNVGGFLRFGKEISEHWDVQIGLGHTRADEDSNAYTGGKYKQTLLGVDALYLFSRDKFRPFLLAGLGAAHNKIDYSGAPGADGSNTSWMANVGLGFQYLFTERLGLQADLRHVWSRAEANGGLFGSGTGNEKETIGNTMLNLGVIFKFGAPAPAPAPVAEPAPQPVAAPEPAPEPAPAPAAEPAPVGPAEPAFEKVTLQSEVLFGFDKDTLKPEGKARLDADIVEKMKAHPEVEIVLITGHTDRIGDANYNQKLSERRARSVKKYLMSQGIEANRLHTVGKGEKEPVVDCKGIRGKKAIECLQPNRRVIVEIEVQRASE